MDPMDKQLEDLEKLEKVRVLQGWDVDDPSYLAQKAAISKVAPRV